MIRGQSSPHGMELPEGKKTDKVPRYNAPNPEAVHARVPNEVGAVHTVRAPWYCAGPVETPNVTPLTTIWSDHPQPVNSQYEDDGLGPQVQPQLTLPLQPKFAWVLVHSLVPRTLHAPAPPAVSNALGPHLSGLHHEERYFAIVH